MLKPEKCDVEMIEPSNITVSGPSCDVTLKKVKIQK